MPAVTLSTADSFVPPDVNNPPFYIPLKNIETRYNIVQELGKGSFGSVTLAETMYDMESSCKNISSLYPETLMDQSLINNVEQENWYYKKKGIVAIKTMMNRLPTLHDYTRVREIKFILQIPAHKNLVTIYEMFIDDSLYHLHIVMECMEQNIYQLMKHRKRRVFSLPTLRSILFQILSGIKHIHDHDFFHRDIKPENILISPAHRYYSKKWLEDDNYSDNYIVKLADYGLARHISNRSPYTTYVSTRWYRSPEILLRKGFYSKPLDIWAYGCVVVELATFSPLFPGSDEVDQIWRILNLLGSPDHTRGGKEHFGGSWPDSKPLYQALNYEFPYVEGKTIKDILPNPQLENLYSVVASCLKWNPDDRFTANKICQLPYFKDCMLNELKQKKKEIPASNGILSLSTPSTNISSASNQWSRILSGLPQKSDMGIIPNFNSPQKLSKVQMQHNQAQINKTQAEQQKRGGGVASWFKFSTHKNSNTNVSIKPANKVDGIYNNDNNNNNNDNVNSHHTGQTENNTNRKIDTKSQLPQNHENIDNEVFTIELDDSMETMTGSEEISNELNNKIELYEDDMNDAVPSLDVDHHGLISLDQENYRIDVLNKLDTDENLAHEIGALDGDEFGDDDEDEEDDVDGEGDEPDSLLNYYQDLMAKKFPKDALYIHSSDPPNLSNQLGASNPADLHEQIPRNLNDRVTQQRMIDCLMGSSDHPSQNLIQSTNSHSHNFQDGLSF